MIYDFDAADLPLVHDTRVVVETERGEAVGWTVGEPEDREPHRTARSAASSASLMQTTKRARWSCASRSARRCGSAPGGPASSSSR